MNPDNPAPPTHPRTSLRRRLTWGMTGLMVGMGVLLILYLYQVPYWTVPKGEQQIILQGEGPLRMPNGDTGAKTWGTISGLIVPGANLTAQKRFWAYAAAGLTVFTLLAGLTTYALTGYFLRSLRALQQQVAQFGATGALPKAISSPGPEREIRDLTRAFNHLLGRLHQVLEDHRHFVNNAAHELRTPLQTARLNLGLLRKAERLTPQARSQALEDMAQALARMERMVTALLWLTRQPQKARWTTVDLSHLAREVLDECVPLAKQSGVTLHLEAPPPGEAVVVHGEPHLLRMALRNLVENGILYNNPGGHVWVRFRREAPWLVVEVQDSGWGIPAKEQRRLFQRFFRGRMAQRRPGSGLGLALVARVVAWHHGRVEVQSAEGRGSTFTLYLPLTSPSPEAKGQARWPSTTTHPRPKTNQASGT